MTDLMQSLCAENNSDVVLSILASEIRSAEDQEVDKGRILLMLLKTKQFNDFKKLVEEILNGDIASQVPFEYYSHGNRTGSFVHGIIASYGISTNEKILIIRFLVLEMGCDVESFVDSQGLLTPLLLICERQNSDLLELIKCVVELGARVSTQDYNHRNALFAYVGSTYEYYGNIELREKAVQYILDDGADVNAKSVDDETVLELAARHKLPKIAQVIEQHMHNIGSSAEIDEV